MSRIIAVTSSSRKPTRISFPPMTTSSTSRSAPPPSLQEVQRKLSVHSTARPKKVRVHLTKSTLILLMLSHPDRSEPCRPFQYHNHTFLEPSPTQTQLSPPILSPQLLSHMVLTRLAVHLNLHYLPLQRENQAVVRSPTKTKTRKKKRVVGGPHPRLRNRTVLSTRR